MPLFLFLSKKNNKRKLNFSLEKNATQQRKTNSLIKNFKNIYDSKSL